MALAIADSNGIKRICTNCGTRYYDMGKKTITCPSCDTEFVGQVKPKVIESLDKEEKKEEETAVDVTAAPADDKKGEEETISLDEVKEDGDADDADEDATVLEGGDLDLDDAETKSDDE